MSLEMEKLRHKCGLALQAYLREGLHWNQAACPSHICIRTADAVTFVYFRDNLAALGMTVEHEHNGKPLLWVKLENPLIYSGYAVEWLEVTAPRPDYPYTGPQMLVYQRRSKAVAIRPTHDKSGFMIRHQSMHASELAAPH